MPEFGYIGAGISCRSFEVKDDFSGTVSGLFDSAPYLTELDGRRYFDLEKCVYERLLETGVKIIERAGICTYRDKIFHSYRRDGASSGRMLTVVVRHEMKQGSLKL